MTQKQGAERHVRQGSEIDGQSATVRFSPSLVKAFANLEQIVHDSKDFDSDLRMNLRHLASGENIAVRSALTSFGLIVDQVADYTEKTGDLAAKRALGDIFDELIGSKANSRPVTVVVPRAIER